MSVRLVSKETVTHGFSKILIASFLAGGVCLGRVHAADKAPDKTDKTEAPSISEVVQGVFQHCHNAVVKIEAADAADNSVLCGTGFFIDPNGTIYTSYSVGGASHDIVVSYGNKKYPATRLLGDPRSGMAILKIEANTPFLPISKETTPAIATPVLAIGYPMDLPLTPSLGVIAGLDSRNSDGYFLTKHIRANVEVQRGQGGAPLLNLKGEVVGIVISGLDVGAGCYALPISAAEKVRTDFVRFGDVHHGWIGIHVVSSGSTASADSSVVVNDLLENTPAAQCGLQKGDLVLQIGDQKVAAPEDVLNASFFLTAGDEVPITVLRGNEKITVKILPIPDVPLNAGASQVSLPLKVH